MVEGAPLLREYGLKAHRGFESLPLRHVHTRRAISPPGMNMSWRDESPVKGFDKSAGRADLGSFAARRVSDRESRIYPSLSAMLLSGGS